MPETCLLTLIAPPALEESLVDWLLEFDAELGFTTSHAHGHSGQLEGLSLAEQVTGRKQRTRFEIHLRQAVAQDLVERLERDFRGSGLHYWVSPVLALGRI